MGADEGGTVISIMTAGMTAFGLMAGTPGGAEAPKDFMSALPDPMKLDLIEIGFVILLVTVMYLVLQKLFFRPVMTVVDERDAAIEAGGAKRAEAAAMVDQRQGAYAARLKELRGQAFEHRKALADAAAREKQALLDQARAAANEQRQHALSQLAAQREAAKTDLLQQVEALSESMIHQLLKRA